MKKETKFLIEVVGLVILCAWTTNQTNDITKAEWLVGTWENKTRRGSIYETWNKTNDNEFSGMSYIIKENDTSVFENIQLVQEQYALFYVQIVKNQNNGLSVRFTAKKISETQLILKIRNTIFLKSFPIQKSVLIV
ncbi:hypothetical protein SAMN05421856_103364 [Chryseobacterium taichungense]|uniref:DUF6265 domain-containing protein n=1 Tax=Chryseobacterium taichungense TaxID=295069 RepID=A0A1H7YLK2_9FLAO|nr:DUF6265 family protein [Chryseobacterium taichungense]SEM46188.1 hypothetical protein SAMN05421856_103364 [Chryseobacterium taichungense]